MKQYHPGEEKYIYTLIQLADQYPQALILEWSKERVHARNI